MGSPGENFDHVTDVGALREKIRRLQADLSACERREQTAERGITHAESKTREVQEKLREVTAKLQARDSEVRELGQAGQTLKDAGAEAKAEATDAKRELGAAKSTITRMTSEMTEKAHRLAALERSVQDLNAQMDATKREKIALASKLTRSEDENRRLREKVNAAAEREKEAAVANAAVATARREAEAMMPAKAAAPPTLFGRPAPPGPPGKRIPIWRSNPRLADSVHLLLTRSGPTTGQPDLRQSPPARRCPRGGARSRTAAE